MGVRLGEEELEEVAKKKELKKVSRRSRAVAALELGRRGHLPGSSLGMLY